MQCFLLMPGEDSGGMSKKKLKKKN